MKVLWSHHGVEEATWEREDNIRSRYPELFYIFSYLYASLFICTCCCLCTFCCICTLRLYMFVIYIHAVSVESFSYVVLNFEDEILLGGKDVRTLDFIDYIRDV